MRINKKVIIFFPIITILQFSGIILALVLENLSTKKMGVARYLMFKKQDFPLTFFTPNLIKIYTIVFVIGAIICLLLLMTKRKTIKLIISLLVTVAANIIGFLIIQYKTDLAAYHFFIIGIAIVIVVQYGWIVFNRFFSKK